MDNFFLFDKNIITYNDLLLYINNCYLTSKNLSFLEKMILDSIKQIIQKKCNTIDDIINELLVSEKEIIFYTSGTTGEPKEIKQKINILIRNVKIGEKYKNNVWGLSYEPTKIASYHVLLQALLNKNRIINLWKKDKKEILRRLKDITHISATPTFYRLLISNNIIFNNIKQLTIGGESSTNNFYEKIKYYFPNADIKNIYASTECGSLLSSKNEYFHIPNKYQNLIKIVENEIWVDKTLVGEIDENKINDNWYKTGDIVEYVNDNEFKIIYRKSNLINIGGFKINLNKIENIANELDYIIVSKAYSKKNSVLGNIICLEVQLKYDIEISKIRKDLSFKLSSVEIPTKIYIVDEIKTINNKIERR